MTDSVFILHILEAFTLEASPHCRGVREPLLGCSSFPDIQAVSLMLSSLTWVAVMDGLRREWRLQCDGQVKVSMDQWILFLFLNSTFN